MPDSIEFFSSGSGRPLIMIHPLGLDHRTWDYCLGELSKYRTVMTYDLPGHGLSPHSEQNYSIEDLSHSLKVSLTDLGIVNSGFYISHAIGCRTCSIVHLNFYQI